MNRSPTFSEAMGMNRAERRRLGKINKIKIPSDVNVERPKITNFNQIKLHKPKEND